MNSKVGEIFTAAGQAFSRLGDLTMQLHPSGETQAEKWTEEEMDMLHASILKFSDDLAKISLSIKNRTVSQIRQALKKKAFEDAGIPAKQVPVQQVQHVMQVIQGNQQQLQNQQPQINKSSAAIIGGNAVVSPTTQSQATSTPQHQAVHIQHVQHLIPVQQNVLQNTASANQTQIIQGTPKQIIIQQAAPQAVQVASTATPSHLTQQQVVHLQPQQLQQLQQGHVQVQAHHQQVIQPAQTNTATTTITLAQFQQIQAQKALLAAAASSASTSSTSNVNAVRANTSLPNTTSTVIASSNISHSNIMNVTTQHQPSGIMPVTTVPSNVNHLVAVNNINTVNAVTLNNSKAASAVTPSAVGNNNAGTITTLKSGPDVTMTLNRINTQENEVDVEECLPADVVKLDFSTEEVAG